MSGPNDKKREEKRTTPLFGNEGRTPHGDTRTPDEPRTTPYDVTPLDEAGRTPSDESSLITQPATSTEAFVPEESLRALAERYDLLAELGRGGMGVVYRARDRETGAEVALKVLLPEISAKADLIERFKSELILARKITHKHVCRVHELIRLGNVAAISMEYVEGESLRAALKRKQGFSVRGGLDVARQILAGLAEAHAQGVVHRDLKPENILIARDGTVKVMDFGIARSLDTGATSTGHIMGTPAYMSPEQAQGNPADARSDVYSLGLILYEMFTGQQTFSADTTTALLLKHIHEEPRAPREVEPHLPAFLDRAILKCIEKKPKERFQSAAAAEKALAGEEKPAAGPAEEIAVPLHLARWQRSDLYALGAAIVSVLMFFLLFDRAFPYSAAAPQVDQKVVAERAREILRKIPAVSGKLSFRVLPFGFSDYYENVLFSGAATNERAIPVFPVWRVDSDGEPKASLFLNKDGALQDLYVSTGQSTKLPARDEAVATAVRFIREQFDKDLSRQIPKVAESAYFEEGHGILYISWEISGPEANQIETFSVRVNSGGVAYASRYVRPLRASPVAAHNPQVQTVLRRWSEFLELALLGPIVVMIFLVLLFFVRRLYLQTIGRIALGALVVTAAIWGGGLASAIWAFHTSHGGRGEGEVTIFLVTLAILSLPLFILVYALLAVADYYLTRSIPAQAASWNFLFQERLRARASGLSLFRGCVLGAICLGLHALLIFALGHSKSGAPNVDWLDWMLRMLPRTDLIGVGAVSLAVGYSIVATWCLVGFPAALGRRISASRWAVVGLPPLFWMATCYPLTGASAFPLTPMLLIAGLQGFYFGLVLYHYDILTVLGAVLTTQFWLTVYPATVVLRRADTVSSLLLLPWFFVLLFGLLLYFRPQIDSGFRRVRSVFE